MQWINIARITWLELWQNKAFKVLVGIALIIPLFAMVLADLFMVDLGKVYMDSIAAGAQLLAIYFIVFIVTKLLSRDIYDRVCYVLMMHPVQRRDYYMGRFLGVSFAFMLLLLVLFVASSLGGMFYVQGKAEFYQSGYAWSILAQLIYFNFFQYIAVIGVVFFIASVSSGDAESMLFTMSVLLFSWLFPPVLKAMQNPDVAEKTPDFIATLLQWVYEILPHLQGGEIALRLAHGFSISWQDTGIYTLEHLTYGIVMLLLGLFFFNRRDL